jgi:hypothetical protein
MSDSRDADRRRNLRLAQQALDSAIGLLRNASDKLMFAAQRLSAARDDDKPYGEHQRNP